MTSLTPEMEAEVRAEVTHWRDAGISRFGSIEYLDALLSEIDALRLERDSWKRLAGEEAAARDVRDEALREVRQWIGDGQFSDGLARAHWAPKYAAVVDLVDAALRDVAEAKLDERAQGDSNVHG